LKARTVIATEWLMSVDSLQKQEGGYAPMSGGSGKRVGLWRAQVSNYKIPAIIDYQNSEEQRETAENKEASRCFFDPSSSKTQAFLRRRSDLSL
jgi:hypothetical protein